MHVLRCVRASAAAARPVLHGGQDEILLVRVVALIVAAVWSVLVSSGSVGLLSSSVIAATSDFSIRSDRPTPRAASGSFFAPNSRMNAPAMISQCHQDILPMFLFSLMSARSADGARRDLIVEVLGSGE